jgi:hypothetical protein
MGTRLEVWSTPVWRSRMKKIAKAPQALVEHLQDLIL